MLWFNGALDVTGLSINTFQYILCCGSTELVTNIPKFMQNFNTSYVVVQLLKMLVNPHLS